MGIMYLLGILKKKFLPFLDPQKRLFERFCWIKKENFLEKKKKRAFFHGFHDWKDLILEFAKFIFCAF